MNKYNKTGQKTALDKILFLLDIVPSRSFERVELVIRGSNNIFATDIFEIRVDNDILYRKRHDYDRKQIVLVNRDIDIRYENKNQDIDIIRRDCCGAKMIKDKGLCDKCEEALDLRYNNWNYKENYNIRNLLKRERIESSKRLD